MRGSKIITDEAARVEFVPVDATQPLPLAQLFAAPAPLEVDLGCGDGSFIAALAAEHPGRNFIGVERLVGRVRTACRKIAARRLTNARIVRADLGVAARTLLPHGSVAVCHVMFPDPWPKRRHERRRTVTPDLLQAISRLLLCGGLLRLTTDDAPYFAHMRRAVAAIPDFATAQEHDDSVLPRSTFETRFVERARPVYRLVLRKVSPDR